MSATLYVHGLKEPFITPLEGCATIDIPHEGGHINLFVKTLDEAEQWANTVLEAIKARRNGE